MLDDFVWWKCENLSHLGSCDAKKKCCSLFFCFVGLFLGLLIFLIRGKFVVTVFNTHQADTKMKGSRAAC